jgi:NADPH:quinone reductase-like Zn-dependent oxidoreductase
LKASFHTKYGPPEVLQIVEVNKPIPKDDEVLIKIHATTVNRTDCGFRQPEYFFVRFFSGVFKPKINILGTEFAGTVEAIGKNVTLFKVGDSVFGLNTFKFGTHAEYVCIPEHRSIALKPENMSFEEAAAICDGLMLAINYIRKIDFKSTPKILINGASGSIGSAAVQLAKYYGAEITAVCRAEHFELIRSLGANKLIDYTKEDFTKTDDTYDTVLDAVGKSSFGKCKNILKPNGVYYSTELGDWAQNVFLPLFNSFRNKKVKFPIPTDNKKDILFFKELIEGGNFRALIDREYPLEKIVEATKYVESGEKVGNVVITIF